MNFRRVIAPSGLNMEMLSNQKGLIFKKVRFFGTIYWIVYMLLYFLIGEWHCKQLCYGITGCTYYKWSSYTKQCDLHYASEVPVPPNSECYSLAARADIGEAMCNFGNKSLTPIILGHGQLQHKLLSLQ